MTISNRLVICAIFAGCVVFTAVCFVYLSRVRWQNYRVGLYKIWGTE